MPVITTQALRLRLEAQVKEQREWMERCGGSLAGYILRYGSASDPNRYGDGGEAIYAADAAVLGALRHRLSLVDAPGPRCQHCGRVLPQRARFCGPRCAADYRSHR